MFIIFRGIFLLKQNRKYRPRNININGLTVFYFNILGVACTGSKYGDFEGV